MKLICRPVPDFWVPRAVYLHSPGNIYISHHICKHLKLKPNYKDVYTKKRRQYQLTDVENAMFEAE
jgi:hypothetical protein